jgi:hypothetical protein
LIYNTRLVYTCTPILLATALGEEGVTPGTGRSLLINVMQTGCLRACCLLRL